MSGQEERRQRTLTEKDLEAITAAVKDLHSCRYTIEPKDMELAGDLISIYKETRSAVIKVLIGAFLFGVMVLFALGVKHGYYGGK